MPTSTTSHPCTKPADNHNIRFMDVNDAGPCVFFSPKQLEELKKGVILARMFEIISDVERKTSKEGKKFCLFRVRHTRTKYERNVVAEKHIPKTKFFDVPY